MARPLFVMFLSTRNQTITHHVFLELRDIGIEKFQILALLFRQLHVAFTRYLGHEDAATCFCRSRESNVLCFRLPASPFEISLADDRKEIVYSPFMKGGESSGQDSMQRRLCSRLSRRQKVNLLSFCLLCLFESANDQQNQRRFSRTYSVVARVLFKLAEPMPLWQWFCSSQQNLYRCGKVRPTGR